MSEVHRIDGQARTVRQLLDGARYTIDFYQREYAWQERQVRELLDDLTGKFQDFYEEGHERNQVASYGHYFLGSVVISNKRAQKFIVDGQQRLTTLSLLLIYLHHLQKDREDKVPVETLIFSSKYGQRSFNLDVEDRVACMDKLFAGETFDPEGANESVRNIAARYQTITEHFPEEVAERALPFFTDWLLENVHLVEIEAYSDEDAYTIFETMNDRGLSLSLPEMLKGYVLANIQTEAKQREVNTLWKQRMQQLKEVGNEEDVDFFKNWLRARHAESIRPGNKGAENRDYERIGSEFHRWVRDQRDKLQLNGSDSFVRLVSRDLDFYARQTLRIRSAAFKLTDGLESIRYNEDRGFTTQTQVLLSALSPDDSPDVIKAKLAVVSDYLDIWFTRRVWGSRSTAQRTVRYGLFNLSKALRDKSVPELATHLRGLLDEEQDTFAKHPDLRAHTQNFYQVRHILARLSRWVDEQCGVASHYEDYTAGGKGKPFEVEHIWPDMHDRFREWFPHPSDFERARNRIGGLVLLQQGHNQSLGALPYEKKRDAYVAHGQSLLTRSLHPLAYQNNPAFNAFIERTGLEFRPVDQFDPAAQQERQELYLRIAEWVWNPSRLDLDGVKPPTHEPLLEPEEQSELKVEKSVRYELRKAFFTELIERAKAQAQPHGHLSPTMYSWLGARQDGFWWNYAVTQDATRVCLDISTFGREKNKALFDQIAVKKKDIEAAFGGKLDWLRMDDKKGSQISVTLPGGYVDETQRTKTVTTAVQTMAKFYAAIREHALGAKKAVGL